MKLPEDSRERTKIIALIVIGAAGVLYAVVQLGGLLLKSGNEKSGAAEDLEEELRRARLEIKRMSVDRETSRATLLRIKEISDKFMLHPRLGNFLIGATDMLERHAKTAGLQLASIREIGSADIAYGRKAALQSEFAVKSYTVRVAVECGFNELVALLSEIERSNRFLCITSLGIDTQTDRDPENHKITLDVQWPTWAAYDTPSKLEEQLEKSVDSKKDTAGDTDSQ